MMAEKVTGIAGSRARAEESATKSREERKGVLRKLWKPALILFVVVIPLLLWWRQDGEETVTKAMAPTPVTTPQKAERSSRPQDGAIAHATWKGLHADGPPVGVESDVQEIPFGCGVNFSHGNGVTYKVRYCFKSCQSEKNWQDHQPGTFPPMSHLKFTVLEEGRGMTKVPFAWNCPGR